MDLLQLPTGYSTAHPPCPELCDSCGGSLVDNNGIVFVCGHSYHIGCYDKKCNHCVEFYKKGIHKNVKKFLTRIKKGENTLTKEDLDEALANYNNTILTYLDLWSNNLGIEGGIELAKSLYKNNSLTYLILNNNQIGSEGGKAFAKVLEENITLKSLALDCNQIGNEGGKELAKALYKNNTLTSLDLCDNELNNKDGKAFEKILGKNTTLISLYLDNNRINESIINRIVILLTKN
ncbi:hypothetical protein C2G38_2225215 [Gigaspora rosea]|uniref:RING-type domain-containing protein n=1 Tax=Gigaspora rosea TaxID=44941 RepID=A0A397U2Y4_9GLOM|nr:hypothetical protein C2G38_2225215 [Gigaspora rosea]